jgi:hypothetical protein
MALVVVCVRWYKSFDDYTGGVFVIVNVGVVVVVTNPASIIRFVN